MRITILTNDEYRKVKAIRDVERLIGYDDILVEKLADISDNDARTINAGGNHLKLDIARTSLKIRSIEDIAYRNGLYDGICSIVNLVMESKNKVNEKKTKSKMTTNPLTGEKS